MPDFCGVVGCSNRKNREKDRFFFAIPSKTDTRGRIDPEKVKRRQAWITALHRSDLTETKLKYMKICSDHFISGRPAPDGCKESPDYIPTLKMGSGRKKCQAASTIARFKRQRVVKQQMGNVVSNTPNCKLSFPAIKNEKYEEFNQNIEETQTDSGINLNKVKEEIKTEIFDDTNIKEEITIEEFNQNIEGTQADTWINLNKVKEVKTEILDNTTIKKEPLDIEFIEIKPKHIIQ